VPKQRSLERIAAETILGLVDWKTLSCWAANELSRPDADDGLVDLAIMTAPDSIELDETLQRVLLHCGIGKMDCGRAAHIELTESANEILAGTDDVLSAARRLNAVWSALICTWDVLTPFTTSLIFTTRFSRKIRKLKGTWAT
jgi:hypothetical protein